MPQSVRPFLMFEGCAEEALRFYVETFPDSAVDTLERYGANQAGPEGSVKLASFRVGGQAVMAIDSPAKHAFHFTPSFSFFVECGDEAELDSAFARLAAGGAVLMPPDNYGFSRKFTWITDRFGVSWQLNLA